jgi:vancomycin aglycone glucosyltransferase
MAVPPNMLSFVESAGLSAVAYGPDSQRLPHDGSFVREFSRIQNPIRMLPQVMQQVNQVWAEKSVALKSLAAGADMLLAGINEQRLAANIADYYDIPLAALHFFPPRVLELGWLHRHVTKEAENAQRAALGLPEATESLLRRTARPAPLEIQAYDEICLPGVAAEWADRDVRRPFVGALTLELPTDVDDEVLSWIADGTPPIYFGFGSTPVASPAETVPMISAACQQLGERALICSGANDFSHIPHSDHVKIVSAVNHTAIFPACRAVVHHGGAGTAAAGLRAGIPALILWLWLDQPIWSAALERLEVGLGRCFSAITKESLVADLRSVLTPRCVARAREVATQLTAPAKSVASAADLLEDTAGRARSG